MLILEGSNPLRFCEISVIKWASSKKKKTESELAELLNQNQFTQISQLPFHNKDVKHTNIKLMLC